LAGVPRHKQCPGGLYFVNGLVLKPEWACIASCLSSISMVGNWLLLKRFEKRL
jgi:Cu+-exporting ATPase